MTKCSARSVYAFNTFSLTFLCPDFVRILSAVYARIYFSLIQSTPTNLDMFYLSRYQAPYAAEQKKRTY